MKEIKLKPRKQLSEIYSSNSLEFSVLDNDGTALTIPVKCKDFITDFFWAEKNKQEISICGFVHKPADYGLDNKWHYLALTFKGEKLGQLAESLQKFLQACETKMGRKDLSKVTAANNDEHIVVKFSSEWIESPVHMGLLTFLLRIGLQYEDGAPNKYLEVMSKSPNKFGSNDMYTLENNLNRFNEMLTGKVPSPKWTDPKTVSAVHFNFGPVSYRG